MKKNDCYSLIYLNKNFNKKLFENKIISSVNNSRQNIIEIILIIIIIIIVRLLIIRIYLKEILFIINERIVIIIY